MPMRGRRSGKNPKRTAANAGRLFFPQSQSLGLDRSDYSPALQDKIVYAGVTNHSFAAASETLAKIGGLAVSPKQVERVTKRIGQERSTERDEALAAYQALPLVQRKGVPQGVTAPALAVVGTDGGRIQILDRAAKAAPAAESVPAVAAPAAVAVAAAETPTAAADRAAAPGAAGQERGRHWREDKVGLLMAMTSTPALSDPCPDIPEGFLDPTRMGKLVRELRKGVPVAEEPAGEAKDPAAEEEALHSRAAPRKPPENQEKTQLG
jgi:hypothetical protein